jgi:zinc transporter, ZIP family
LYRRSVLSPDAPGWGAGSTIGTETLIVFLAASVTALATGLGALPFLYPGFRGDHMLGISNALAAGVMLGASASLVVEGLDRNAWLVAAGVAAGALFVFGMQRLLHRFGDPDLASLGGANAHKALLIIAVMTAHSVAEGVGVGASFGGGNTLGWVIAVAIAIHNIPEGVAISLVLVPRGVRVRSAALWSIFTSLPQPLLAVPAFLFVEEFRTILPAGLGFAAGAMVWMVWKELVPEALVQVPQRRVAVGWIAVSFAAMFAFQTYLLS